MSAIDWLPKRNGCVGVAAVKNVNFDERVQLSGQARTYNRRMMTHLRALTVRPLIIEPQIHPVHQLYRPDLFCRVRPNHMHSPSLA